MTHWTACLFYLVGVLETEQYGVESWITKHGLLAESDLGKIYAYAVYFSIMTLSTVGYGDIHPVSYGGRIFGIFAMILGACVFAYGMTNILQMVSQINKGEQEYREKMDRINRYMDFRKLPVTLKNDIREFFHYTHSTNLEKQMVEVEKEILKEMSPSLSHEVIMFVNKSIIEKVRIFQEVDHTFFHRIVRYLQPATFAPNEFVVKEHNDGHNLYIISKGVVEVLVGPNMRRIEMKQDGDYFGAVTMLRDGYCKGKLPYTVRTLTYCDFRTISAKAFRDALLRYPAAKSTMRRFIDEECDRFLKKKSTVLSRSSSETTNDIMDMLRAASNVSAVARRSSLSPNKVQQGNKSLNLSPRSKRHRSVDFDSSDLTQIELDPPARRRSSNTLGEGRQLHGEGMKSLDSIRLNAVMDRLEAFLDAQDGNIKQSDSDSDSRNNAHFDAATSGNEGREEVLMEIDGSPSPFNTVSEPSAGLYEN